MYLITFHHWRKHDKPHEPIEDESTLNNYNCTQPHHDPKCNSGTLTGAFFGVPACFFLINLAGLVQKHFLGCNQLRSHLCFYFAWTLIKLGGKLWTGISEDHRSASSIDCIWALLKCLEFVPHGMTESQMFFERTERLVNRILYFCR